MEKITDRDVKVAINITLSSDGQQREDELAHLFRFYYKTLMQAEGKFHGSVWHKSENLDLRRTWTFSSSAFYSITLFSTIGYGTIACQTTAGRIITIIYACIGLPLMLVVLGDLGEWFQKILTQSYIFCLCKVRRFLNKEDLSEEELEAVFLPIWLALPLVALYVFLTAFFIILFDHDEGQQPGIQTWDAVYFTFISLTTIGLGDVMPFNIQYSPILACVFLLGLALVSIVNTSVYAQLYDLFFKTVLWMEETLEKIHRQQNKGTGYYVFQDLGPSIQLLVCSFPHVDDIDMVAAPIKAMFQPLDIFMKGKHKHKKLLIPHIFKKIKKESEPQSPTSPRFRAPTLGAFGGVDLSQQKSVTKRITRHASDVAAGKIAKQIRARSVDEHPFSVERASAAELVKKAMASTIIDITKEFSSQNEEPRLPTPEVEPPPYFAIVMSEQEEEPLSNLTIEEELSEPEDLSGTSENSPSQNTNMDNPNDNL